MEKITRIQELVKQLNQYRHEYYNLNKPTVSDATYDNFFDQLKSLEEETGFILSNSPTQTVGYQVVSKLQKIQHPIPLKSLDKTKSIDELVKWSKNKELLLMIKADGLTIELDYDNGVLVEASTRGNGEIGEIVTHNAKVFKNIPLRIPFKGKLSLSGEAVIHRNDFEKINSLLPEEEKYATPRNLVAGSVRQLDSKICAKRDVYFYAFNILRCSEKLLDTKYDNLNWLLEQGFWTVICTKTTDIREELINALKKMAEDDQIPIDGMVLTFNDIKYAQSLGETSHHPLHSIAYKFGDETEETVLRAVEWNTTRSGQVNPTAVFDTVILDNTEVSRASLFNLTFIKDMQLNLLCSIKVSKRNMIIPYIEENLDRYPGNYISIPDKCPTCGGKTEIRNTGTAEFLFCTNLNCQAKLLDKFVHFVKRDCMNIDGLSEATLEKFIDKGWLSTFSDIYNLKQYKTQIVKLDGFGSRSYDKLIEAIEKSRKVKMENFLFALGISQIGKSSSKAIAKHFNNDWFSFVDALCNDFDFTQLPDFGDIANKSLHDWYNNSLERPMWLGLTYIVDFVKEEKKEVISMDNPLAGKKLYCTGTFESYKKDELKAIVEGLGAEFGAGYAKSLDYLVVGKIKGSSKEDKARKDGVEILSEDEFLSMIGK